MLPLDSETLKHFVKHKLSHMIPLLGPRSDFCRSWQFEGMNIHQRTAAWRGNDSVEAGTTDVTVLARLNYCCSGQLRLQDCLSELAYAGLSRRPRVAALPYISCRWCFAGSTAWQEKTRARSVAQKNDDVQAGIKMDRSERLSCTFLLHWELCRVDHWR